MFQYVDRRQSIALGDSNQNKKKLITFFRRQVHNPRMHVRCHNRLLWTCNYCGGIPSKVWGFLEIVTYRVVVRHMTSYWWGNDKLSPPKNRSRRGWVFLIFNIMKFWASFKHADKKSECTTNTPLSKNCGYTLHAKRRGALEIHSTNLTVAFECYKLEWPTLISYPHAKKFHSP